MCRACCATEQVISHLCSSLPCSLSSSPGPAVSRVSCPLYLFPSFLLLGPYCLLPIPCFPFPHFPEFLWNPDSCSHYGAGPESGMKVFPTSSYGFFFVFFPPVVSLGQWSESLGEVGVWTQCRSLCKVPWFLAGSFGVRGVKRSPGWSLLSARGTPELGLGLSLHCGGGTWCPHYRRKGSQAGVSEDGGGSWGGDKLWLELPSFGLGAVRVALL